MVNKKYYLEPQTKYYDSMGANWKPFVMFSQYPNLRSKYCNTDKFGLRFNNIANDIKNNNSIFDQNFDKTKELAVIVGGSFAFGEGSSKDQHTISNILSNNTKFNFLNLAGRGYSGYQEIMIFLSHIQKLKEVKKILIISGLNDLILSDYIKNYDQHTGPIFGHDLFISRMREPAGWKGKILKKLFGSFFSNTDWSKINRLNFYNELFKSKKKEDFFSSQDNKDNNSYLNLIEKNLTIWSFISKGLNIPINFILQPTSIWQEKILSSTEQELFSLAEKVKSHKDVYKNINSEKYLILKKKIELLAGTLKFNFFDLNKSLREKKIRDTLYVDKVHMNDLGYKTVSSEIIKNLKL